MIDWYFILFPIFDSAYSIKFAELSAKENGTSKNVFVYWFSKFKRKNNKIKISIFFLPFFVVHAFLG